MLHPFIDFLESMMIATEADDITGQAENEVRTVIGDNRTTNDGADRDEEDLEKVDDIFGIQENRELQQKNDDPSGNPQQDQEDGAEPMSDGQGDDNPSTDGNEDNLDGQSDPNLDDSAEAPEEEPVDENLAFAKKNRIRDNLVNLYTIVSGEIELIVNSLNSIDNITSIQVLNAVLKHLRSIKSYAYKTLTQNLAKIEYDELLRRYITLKRVFEICEQMLSVQLERTQNPKSRPTTST